jgi:hypothetical protein
MGSKLDKLAEGSDHGEYWVIIWRDAPNPDGSPGPHGWGWIRSLRFQDAEVTTIDKLKRKHWRTYDAVMVAVWICRRDSSPRINGETFKAVRVTYRTGPKR